MRVNTVVSNFLSQSCHSPFKGKLERHSADLQFLAPSGGKVLSEAKRKGG